MVLVSGGVETADQNVRVRCATLFMEGLWVVRGVPSQSVYRYIYHHVLFDLPLDPPTGVQYIV